MSLFFTLSYNMPSEDMEYSVQALLKLFVQFYCTLATRLSRMSWEIISDIVCRF